MEFADRDSAAGLDVNAVAILDQPTGGGQQTVDISAGAILWLARGWNGHGRFVAYFTA
jgi:hypothetical protein